MSKELRSACELKAEYKCETGGNSGDCCIVFEGKTSGDKHYCYVKNDKTDWTDFKTPPFNLAEEYNYWVYGEFGTDGSDQPDHGSPGWSSGTHEITNGGREAELYESIHSPGLGPETGAGFFFTIKVPEGRGLFKTKAVNKSPGTFLMSDKCPDDGGTTPPDPGNPDPDPDPAPPTPPPPTIQESPTVEPVPPGANGGNGNCGEDFQCGNTPEGCTPINVQSRMTGPGVWTHDWGGAPEIVSMEVINKDDEQNHRIIVEFASCLPSISENSCITGDLTSLGAFQLENGIPDDDYGDIIRVSTIDVKQLNDTTYEFFFYGTIQQEPGTNGSSSGINDKSFVPADWTFYCCEGAEGGGEGRDPNLSCKTSSILSTGYTNPTFFTHAFDPGMVRSVVVINPNDPNGRFLRITFDPHVCDVDEITASLCLCTSNDANGDPIVEFGAITVTKVDDYTIDVVIKGKIIETHGYKG